MAKPSPCLGIGHRRGSTPSAFGCCTSSSARLRRPCGPRRPEMERKGVSYVTATKLVSRNGGRIQPHPLPHHTSSTASSPTSGPSSPPLASPTTILEVAPKDHRCYVAAAVFFKDIIKLCFKDGN